MAQAADPGGRREDKAQAVAAQIASLWTAAETAILAALTASVRKAANDPGSRQAQARRFSSQAAAIIAVAEQRTTAILKRSGTDPDAPVPVPGQKARTIAQMVTAAGTVACQSARAIFAGVMKALPAGVAAVRIAAAQKELRELAERGITAFTDAAGHDWDLVTYLELASRSAISDLADEQQIRDLGHAGTDLALIWSAWAETACKKCVPWLGKIISLSGSVKTGAKVAMTGSGGRNIAGTVAGTYAEARAAGWRHPDCRCSMTGLSDGTDLSPLDLTPETEAEGAVRRAAVAKQQERQRAARNAARLAVLSLTPHQKAEARRHLARLRGRAT